MSENITVNGPVQDNEHLYQLCQNMLAAAEEWKNSGNGHSINSIYDEARDLLSSLREEGYKLTENDKLFVGDIRIVYDLYNNPGKFCQRENLENQNYYCLETCYDYLPENNENKKFFRFVEEKVYEVHEGKKFGYFKEEIKHCHDINVAENIINQAQEKVSYLVSSGYKLNDFEKRDLQYVRAYKEFLSNPLEFCEKENLILYRNDVLYELCLDIPSSEYKNNILEYVHDNYKDTQRHRISEAEIRNTDYLDAERKCLADPNEFCKSENLQHYSTDILIDIYENNSVNYNLKDLSIYLYNKMKEYSDKMLDGKKVELFGDSFFDKDKFLDAICKNTISDLYLNNRNSTGSRFEGGLFNAMLPRLDVNDWSKLEINLESMDKKYADYFKSYLTMSHSSEQINVRDVDNR